MVVWRVANTSQTAANMDMTLSITPLISLIAGMLILVVPRWYERPRLPDSRPGSCVAASTMPRFLQGLLTTRVCSRGKSLTGAVRHP